MRARFLLVTVAAASLSASPALAHAKGGHEQGRTGGTVVRTYPGHWGGPFGMWYGGWQPQVVVNVPNPPMQQPYTWQNGAYEGQNLDRDSWLRECRKRLGDHGVGGAVIGGLVGGVAGNVIAGRGNRVLGTVAGAAVGAVAGAVIDKAEDRTRVQDRCEAMLASPPAQAYGSVGYGMTMMMVPVMMVPVVPQAQPAQAEAERPYKETVVTEEYWVDAPRRSRHMSRRAAPSKRVRLVPDKRVPQ